MIARASGRPEEAFALLRHALRLALEHDLTEQAALAYGNLSDACFLTDRYSEALDALAEALVLARRIGSRNRELFILAETSYALAMSGRWEEALAIYQELPEDQLRTNTGLASVLSGVLEILIHRGRVEEARSLFARPEYLRHVPELQDRAIYAGARAALFHAEGRYREALEAGAEDASARSRCRPAGRQAGPRLGGRLRARARRERACRRAAFDGSRSYRLDCGRPSSRPTRTASAPG